MISTRFFSQAAIPKAVVGKSIFSKGMKRFWKNVEINYRNGEYKVLLDGRTVKTPFGNSLSVSSPLMADIVADEWNLIKDVVKPHDLLVTSLVSRAQDGLSNEEERNKVILELKKYLDTDTICYHHEFPETLVKLQNEYWLPIIKGIENTFEIKIKTTTGISGIKQSDETESRLMSHVNSFDNLRLAGFEKAVMHSKSFLIALALMKRRITVEEASMAAMLESLAQSQLWGQVEGSHDLDMAYTQMQLGSAATINII